MKINKVYIKGKYICPFVAFIWLVTILCIVAYNDSWLIDQLLLTTLLKLVANIFNVNIKKKPKVKYNPMFVNDKCKLPNKGAFKLNKSLISNWSKGLWISVYVNLDIVQK